MVITADRSPIRETRSERPPLGAPTVGVEEEFSLLDPRTGAVVLRAAEVLRDCYDPTGVVAESMAFMLETRTPVCRTLAEVREALLVRRGRVADAARQHGAVVVASGLAPFGLPDPPAITDDARYLEMARRFPHAMSTNGFCGCHVHVSVPTRQVGVEVLLRLRRWLPALIALTANSPIWKGRDAGRASQRLAFAARWPTVAPAPPVWSAAEYDDLVRRVVSAGDALDDRSVYFLARLSPRYPTVEVRLADVGLTIEETLGYTGLVRALVSQAIDDVVGGRPVVHVPQAALHASCTSAARVGLSGELVDPQTGERIEAWGLVDRLVDQVRPQLSAEGDEDVVIATLERLRLAGGGAERQRRMLRSTSSPAAFVAALAEATAGDLPG